MFWRKHVKSPFRFCGTKFVTATETKLLNARIKGPINSHVHDEALLNRIVRSPIGQEIYSQERDLNRLAATLASNLIKNPVFAGGNKRTALLATGLFLLRNGMKLRAAASQVVGNDAMVEVHCGLSTGRIDETEFYEICRRLWRSTAISDARRPLSTQDRRKGSMRELILSVPSRNEQFHPTTAILYQQNEDDQVVDCLIGDQSIFLEKRVTSLLTTASPVGQPTDVYLRHRHVSSEEYPGCSRLEFPDKGQVFSVLGHGRRRRTGVMFSDEQLDYSVISSTETSGESFVRLEKICC